MKKHKVFNLIILDESGSMESIKPSIISGFNELVQTIRNIEAQFPEQEHYVSLVTFNGMGIKPRIIKERVIKLAKLDEKNYQPDSMTPLFDALGQSINRLRYDTASLKDYNVLVTVLTDGMENASKEFTGTDIRNLIEDLRKKGWTFTYIGTDHDVEKVAISLSINNNLVFEKSPSETKKMFSRENDSRQAWAQKIRDKKDLDGGFYEEAGKKGDGSTG